MKKTVIVVGRFTHSPTRMLKGNCIYCHDDFERMAPRSAKKLTVCQKKECRKKYHRAASDKCSRKKRLKNENRN